MTDDDPLELEELDEFLAEELDMDVEELREAADNFEIAPPWEAGWVEKVEKDE